MDIKHKLFLALVPVLLVACHKEVGLLSSNTMVADKENVANLDSLMAAHPELSTASLKDIKNAASMPAKNDVAGAMEIKFASDAEDTGDPKTGPLDKVIAKQAQNLIDKILTDFNIEAHLSADVKVLGILMNMQRDVTEKMEKESNLPPQNNTSNEAAGAHVISQDEKGQVTIPTCEEFVEKPFGDMPKDKIMAMLNKNHEKLKNTISGCAKIQGEPFVRCMENFNKMASLVNEHANCDMKNLAELTQIAEKEFGKSFSEIQRASKECMNTHFFKCGFKMEKTKETTK